MKKTMIIAEAGVNHNGSIDLAKKLIDVAADAGADYVKFQTFKAEKIVSKSAQTAAYQKTNLNDNTVSQYEMIKKLELDVDTHHILYDYCKLKNIKFLSTAFDLDSIDLLEKIGIDFYKIPSGEITNKPYIEKIATKGLPVILSTGMSTLSEIQDALDILVDGGIRTENISILHCNTEYPTPLKDVHLNAMNTIQKKFGTSIGYSDHTLGIEVSLAAVAMGANVIEKHFTLDRNMEGPDHKASLEPSELKQLVTLARNIDIALGGSVKQPSPSEIKNKVVARKSIHIAHNLKQGHQLVFEDLIMKRPGSGISPMKYDDIIGRTLNKNVLKDHLLKNEDLV